MRDASSATCGGQIRMCPEFGIFYVVGGFSCNGCKDGYHGGGFTCVPSEECNPSVGTMPCSANAECLETKQSHLCICNDGWV